MTNPTTQFAFKNTTSSSTVYAYVTGQDINKDNAYAFLQADGVTLYYPESPSQTLQPLAVDCAIPLGAPGTTKTVTIPQLAGGRIWFVVGDKLTFYINPGPGIVEPSVTNTDDANYNLNWAFCEFTCYVDFVSLPIALELLNTSGQTQVVQGLPTNGLDQICAQLTAQGASENPGWAELVIKGPDGNNLRAMSPNSGRIANSGLFDGYYQSYVDTAWAKYSAADLSIDTQGQWGVLTGRVCAASGLLSFGDDVGAFAKPSATDIFSCSTGPFGNYPAATVEEMGAIGARLAAALNRSTLVSDANQPDGALEADGALNYYQTNPTNHYARIVHGVNLDGRGYAFPYDDVVPTGATGPDQAGTVYDGSPQLLTVTVGGPGSGGSGAGRREDGKDGVGGGDEEKKKKGKKTGLDISGFFKKVMAMIKGIFHHK
ncbi:glucanase B [Ustulina deusta]|nr:glucanase B [Ustulina deusta]